MFRRKKRNNKISAWIFKFVLIPALSALIGAVISYGFFILRMKRERAEVQDVSILIQQHDVTPCFQGSKVIKFNQSTWRLYQAEIIIKNTGYADLSELPVECIIDGYITGRPHITKEPVKTTIETVDVVKAEPGMKIDFTISALRRNQYARIELFYFTQKKNEPSLPLCEIEKPGIRIKNLDVLYR